VKAKSLTGLKLLNHKYDVCSCLSESEDINPGVLSVQTEFIKVSEGACHEDSPWIHWLIYIRPLLKYVYGRWLCDTF